MKTLITITLLVISLLFAPILHAQNTQNPSGKQTETDLEMAYASLIDLYESYGISFRTEDDRADFLVSLLKIQKAITLAKQTQKDNDQRAKVDEVLQEARMVQAVMASYFGNKNIFGYHLKQSPVSIRVEAGGVYEKLTRRFPFLSGVAVGGTVTVNPGEQIVTQFNSLKTEFCGLLVEVAHLDKTDSRLKSLASWGKDTKVIYPGATFGEGIIESQQFLDMKLDN